MDIQLSICIATYNRADFIGETLDSIISQANDQVEIVVSDGGSSDHTAQVIDKYQKQFPRLRYFIEETNSGVDQGFNQAVKLAQGKYCWLMSDDDVLKPGAIQSVLAETVSEYGLIIVNAEVRNFDLSSVVVEKRLPIDVNRIYEPKDGQAFFVNTANHLSFIGCVIIKKQLWDEREKEKYFGTVFIHVGVIFQKTLSENILVIAEPLVSIRYGNALWTARGFEIWMFKWPNLIWSFSDYTDEEKRQVYPKEPWKKLTTLLLYRALGSFSIKEYDRWIAPQMISGWHKFVCKIIARAPGYVLNTLEIMYFFIIHRESRMLLIDLRKSRFYLLRGLK